MNGNGSVVTERREGQYLTPSVFENCSRVKHPITAPKFSIHTLQTKLKFLTIFHLSENRVTKILFPQ